MRVAIDAREIGELSCLDTPDAILGKQLPCCIDGDRAECLVHRDRLFGCERFAEARLACHGGAHQAKRLRWIHRGIRVQAHAVPGGDGGSDRH